MNLIYTHNCTVKLLHSLHTIPEWSSINNTVLRNTMLLKLLVAKLVN